MTREVVGRQAKPETPEQAFLYLWENFRNPDQDYSICEFAVDPGLFVRPDPSQQTGMRVDSDLNPYDQWKWLLKWVEDHRKNLEAHIQQGCGWLHDSQTVTALFHAKQQLEAKKLTTTAADEKETITAVGEIAELERSAVLLQRREADHHGTQTRGIDEIDALEVQDHPIAPRTR